MKVNFFETSSQALLTFPIIGRNCMRALEKLKPSISLIEEIISNSLISTAVIGLMNLISYNYYFITLNKEKLSNVFRVSCI